jgi:hypothetical protein
MINNVIKCIFISFITPDNLVFNGLIISCLISKVSLEYLFHYDFIEMLASFSLNQVCKYTICCSWISFRLHGTKLLFF